MSDTISKEIKKNANQTVTITDDLGREIVIGKPSFSLHLKLLKALGPELAKNTAYVENVAGIVAVKSIDGQPVPVKTDADIEMLVSQLEQSDNALELIIEAIVKNFTDVSNPEEIKEQVKK